MKKTVLLSLLFILSWGGFTSYGQAFDTETQVIAVGVGLGSSLGSFNYSTQIPGLSIQYERGMWEAGNSGVISLGGYVGYKRYSYSTSSGSFEATSSWNYTIVGIRSAYHYQGLDNDKVDLFGGIMLGYNLLNYSYKDNSGSSMPAGGNYGSTAGLTIYAGARYYFAENIAAFAELGYGVSYLNLGVALKF